MLGGQKAGMFESISGVLQKLRECAFQLLKILNVVLEDIVNNPTDNIYVFVYQRVAEADHADPFFF